MRRGLLFYAGMLVLALDTSTAAGSVALADGETVLACRVGDPSRTHGARLPGDVKALLDAHALAAADVDRYAVCSGPGSFTGLRVGLATIQALALVSRRPVVTAPTLEAVAIAAVSAAAGDERPALAGAWMNAHRGEVFAALYEVRDAAGAPPARGGVPDLVELSAPAAAAPDAVLRRWSKLLRGDNRRLAVVGDAVGPWRPSLERSLGGIGLLASDVPPLAPIAARIAVAAPSRDAAGPHAVRPVYVRRPDAELARGRRRAAGARPG